MTSPYNTIFINIYKFIGNLMKCYIKTKMNVKTEIRLNVSSKWELR